jgi:hypothetical protein
MNQAVAISSRYASQIYKAIGDEGGEAWMRMLARQLSVGLENAERGHAFLQQQQQQQRRGHGGQMLGEQGDNGHGSVWEESGDPWEGSSGAVGL